MVEPSASACNHINFCAGVNFTETTRKSLQCTMLAISHMLIVVLASLTISLLNTLKIFEKFSSTFHYVCAESLRQYSHFDFWGLHELSSDIGYCPKSGTRNGWMMLHYFAIPTNSRAYVMQYMWAASSCTASSFRGSVNAPTSRGQINACTIKISSNAELFRTASADVDHYKLRQVTRQDAK